MKEKLKQKHLILKFKKKYELMIDFDETQTKRN